MADKEEEKFNLCKELNVTEEWAQDMTSEALKLNQEKNSMVEFLRALTVDLSSDKEKAIFFKGYMFGRMVEQNESKSNIMDELSKLSKNLGGEDE